MNIRRESRVFTRDDKNQRIQTNFNEDPNRYYRSGAIPTRVLAGVGLNSLACIFLGDNARCLRDVHSRAWRAPTVVSARGLLVEVVFLNIITVEEVVRQPCV